MMFADQQIPDDVTVTPGLEGFLTFFALAIIVVLLVLSMSKHLRRVDTRAAQEEADEADRLAAEASEIEKSDNSDDGVSPSDASLTDIAGEPSEAERREP